MPLRFRTLLSTLSNPMRERDYLVTFAIPAHALGEVTLRYVPDALLLEPGALARYLDALAEEYRALPPEALAARLLEDANNELVPRWIHLTLRRREGMASHAAVAEDRQPKWDNSALLSRLERI